MAMRDFFIPNGMRTRGTIIIVPGRGEAPAVYARLGSRLAYDAYRVRVTDLPGTDPADVAAFLRELAQGLARAVEDIGDELARPLVLLGSDLGAAGIAALLADVVPDAVWWPQAAVLAGVPGYRARYDGGWEDELNIRTYCPTHRGVLADGAAVQHRSVAAEIVAFLEALRDDLTPAVTIETSAW